MEQSSSEAGSTAGGAIEKETRLVLGVEVGVGEGVGEIVDHNYCKHSSTRISGL